MNKKNIYDAIYINDIDIKKNPDLTNNYIIYAIKNHLNLIFEINYESILFIEKFLKTLKIKEGNIYCICKKINKVYFNYICYKFVANERYNIHFLKEKLNIINPLHVSDVEPFSKENIVPTVSNNINKIQDYSIKLVQYHSKVKNIYNIYEKKLIKQFNKTHMFKIKTFNELFDRELGAVVIEDSDVIALKNETPIHPIVDLYELDCLANNLKYSCNQDNNIILRGPDNYYYYMCYITGNIKTDLEIINKKLKIFLNKAIDVFSNSALNPFENINDLKLILSILDIAKNTATNNIYYFIRKNVYEDNTFLIYDILKKDNHDLYDCYELLKFIYDSIYDILFMSCEHYNNSKMIKILEKTKEIQSKVTRDSKKQYKFDYTKIFRMWRETDNVIENIILFISIKDDIYEIFSDTSKKLLLLGINYGSIDLAILATSLFERLFKKTIHTGELIVNLSYPQVYTSNLLDLNINNIFCMDYNKISQNYNCILIDDNIISGKSLQAAINITSKYINNPLFNVIIRYPEINRVNQMYCKVNNSQVKVEMFSNYLKGLISRTYFTKLNDLKNPQSYLNRLKVFDLSKDHLEEMLFKNRLFSNNSHIYKKYLTIIMEELDGKRNI